MAIWISLSSRVTWIENVSRAIANLNFFVNFCTDFLRSKNRAMIIKNEKNSDKNFDIKNQNDRKLEEKSVCEQNEREPQIGSEHM